MATVQHMTRTKICDHLDEIADNACIHRADAFPPTEEDLCKQYTIARLNDTGDEYKVNNDMMVPLAYNSGVGHWPQHYDSRNIVLDYYGQRLVNTFIQDFCNDFIKYMK